MSDAKDDQTLGQTGQQQGGGGPTGGQVRDAVAILVGLFFLMLFSCIIVFMLSQTGLSELRWTRALYLLSGIEAVAFAAAGFFFGGTISRKETERAERRAAQAAGDAADAIEEATSLKVAATQSQVRLQAVRSAIDELQQKNAQQRLGLAKGAEADAVGAVLDVLGRVAGE
jgi:hypothetical protein